MARQPSRRLSIALLLTAVIIWGGSYVVTKSGLNDLPPALFALLRYCVACVVLIPLALARRSFAQLPRPVPRGVLFLMALTGVAAYYMLYNLALTYTTASQVALIQSGTPAVTAVMAALWLGERVTNVQRVGIALAVAGVALVVMQSGPDLSSSNPTVGSALALGSVIVWSLYTILAKRAAKADAIAVTTIVTVIGAVLLLPAALAENWGEGISVSGLSASAWLKIGYVGVLSSAVSYFMYNRALRDVDATIAGTFINLGPVIGVICGFVFLGERMTALGILGGALALAGVWISTRNA